ncbi:MAG TPA: Lrp/AsnC family transcriptional regulator [Nitrososphaeraceae archaeon]|nr:Lrp/AsnC family transcriptional regulator [Nitrososphaeraceae archaeon]
MPRINNKRNKSSSRSNNSNSSKRNSKARLNYNNNNNNNNNNSSKSTFDEIDKKIIELLISNYDNSSIAKKLKIPLSTIQRRTRKLFEREIVSAKIELNYEKLGYKRGLLHIYLEKGMMDNIGKTIVEKRGMLSVSVHVGNSDLVALFVYRDSKDLIETMGEIKEIEGVNRVLWSEEVYFITSPSEKNLFI